MLEYPKWLYKSGEAKLVQDKAEHAALGAGWFESPAEAPEAAPADDAPAEADAAPVKPKGKLKSILAKE